MYINLIIPMNILNKLVTASIFHLKARIFLVFQTFVSDFCLIIKIIYFNKELMILYIITFNLNLNATHR